MHYTPYLCDVKYCEIVVSLTRLRDVYLYYDPISSGYIRMLPEGSLVILVEVFKTLKLVYLKVVLPQLVSEPG